jgi:predicted nucleic-acid-binding protein
MKRSQPKRGAVRAIDTNVLVRFLVADDARQAKRARAVIEAGDVFIATTVLMETEWVLRSAYDFDVEAVATALRGVAGLPGVRVEELARLAQALDWMMQGMDFADALHLSRIEECDAFLSFDKELAKRAPEDATAVEMP